MPALRKYRPSVAPITMVGMARTPGHMLSVMREAARKRSGRIGDDGPASISRPTVIDTWSSATTFFKVARTSSGFISGKMRQFTIAPAVCGRAFRAWPPSSIVATQVVRQGEGDGPDEGQ